VTAQIVCAIIYVAGLALTVINGWLAYADTVATLQGLTQRVVSSDRYRRETAPPAQSALSLGVEPAPSAVDSTHDTDPHQRGGISAHDLAAHLAAILRRNRLKLFLAAGGILLNTAVSIAALFIP
jgi:hypothetical protein